MDARSVEKEIQFLKGRLSSLETLFKKQGKTNQGYLINVQEKGGHPHAHAQIPIEEKQQSAEDSAEESISNERQSYAEGLSIHGLSRIVSGKPLSRLIWTVLVISSLTVAILITKEHWDAYLRHDSVTTTTITTQNEIPMPAVTICNYGDINRARRHFDGRSPLYSKPALVDLNMRGCGQDLNACMGNNTAIIKVQNVSADYVRWATQNDLVKFDETTNCYTISNYVQTVPSDILSVQIVADRTWDLWTELYINSAEETFLEASSTVYWASEGFYHVNIEKKIIQRLGLPYTDCVEGAGSYAQNKFEGNYTVKKCKKGCLFEKVFEKCGNVPLMYKKHMREPHRFDNQTYVSNTDGEACLRSLENDYGVTAECDDVCHLQPCYEEDIKMSLDYHWSKDPNFLEFVLTFQTFLVEQVDEVPAYTWQDLFANFGGCVGLMTGASILSFFELFIYFALIVMDYFDIYSKCKCSKVSPKGE
ncbi:acid-sensing ion channel 4-A-like [Clytia hemisphaerica]